jgi:hypothetical protein
MGQAEPGVAGDDEAHKASETEALNVSHLTPNLLDRDRVINVMRLEESIATNRASMPRYRDIEISRI